jgi:hypothetical protein
LETPPLYLFIIIPAALLAIIIMAGAYGKKKKTGMDADFRKALSGLPLGFGSFYNKMIAAGMYREHPVYFYYMPVAKNELLPLACDMAIVCGMKIPGIHETGMHLVALKEQDASPARKALGWMNPDPGVFIAAARGGSQEESLRLYRKLSAGARSGLSDCAQRMGSATLVTDWLEVIVGRKHAREMYPGGNEKLSSLELQVKVPLNIGHSDLVLTLDELVRISGVISKDLGGTA